MSINVTFAAAATLCLSDSTTLAWSTPSGSTARLEHVGGLVETESLIATGQKEVKLPVAGKHTYKLIVQTDDGDVHEFFATILRVKTLTYRVVLIALLVFIASAVAAMVRTRFMTDIVMDGSLSQLFRDASFVSTPLAALASLPLAKWAMKDVKSIFGLDPIALFTSPSKIALLCLASFTIAGATMLWWQDSSVVVVNNNTGSKVRVFQKKTPVLQVPPDQNRVLLDNDLHESLVALHEGYYTQKDHVTFLPEGATTVSVKHENGYLKIGCAAFAAITPVGIDVDALRLNLDDRHTAGSFWRAGPVEAAETQSEPATSAKAPEIHLVKAASDTCSGFKSDTQIVAGDAKTQIRGVSFHALAHDAIEAHQSLSMNVFRFPAAAGVNRVSVAGPTSTSTGDVSDAGIVRLLLTPEQRKANVSFYLPNAVTLFRSFDVPIDDESYSLPVEFLKVQRPAWIEPGTKDAVKLLGKSFTAETTFGRSSAAVIAAFPEGLETVSEVYDSKNSLVSASAIRTKDNLRLEKREVDKTERWTFVSRAESDRCQVSRLRVMRIGRINGNDELFYTDVDPANGVKLLPSEVNDTMVFDCIIGSEKLRGKLVHRNNEARRGLVECPCPNPRGVGFGR